MLSDDTLSFVGAGPHARSQNSPRGRYSEIILHSDAIQAVEALLSRQMERSVDDRPPINTPISGDAEARGAFWLLLPTNTQRSVFLARCKSREFWPRIRTLIGSPPFCFLRPEDDFVLNAGGINATRSHMAPQESGSIPSSGDIGDGHFHDRNARIYKVSALECNTLAPGANSSLDYRNMAPGKKVVLDIKLPRMKQADRAKIHKSSNVEMKRRIFFPVPGETIELAINEKLATDSTTFDNVVIRVKGVQQRHHKSPVCRAFCVVV